MKVQLFFSWVSTFSCKIDIVRIVIIFVIYTEWQGAFFSLNATIFSWAILVSLLELSFVLRTLNKETHHSLEFINITESYVISYLSLVERIVCFQSKVATFHTVQINYLYMWNSVDSIRHSCGHKLVVDLPRRIRKCADQTIMDIYWNMHVAISDDPFPPLVLAHTTIIVSFNLCG